MPENIPKRAVIVFVKNPELGKVKTRLAKTLGDEQALEIYIKLLHKTRDAIASLSMDCHIFYDQYINPDDLWDNNIFQKQSQLQSPDLGARMSDAFRRILLTYDQAVIIGSDCPLMSSSVIINAFSELKDSDTCIGPSLDGGYYLLGMNAYHPELFEGITWSQATVFASTIIRMNEKQISHSILDYLPDIDYEADWEQYGW